MDNGSRGGGKADQVQRQWLGMVCDKPSVGWLIQRHSIGNKESTTAACDDLMADNSVDLRADDGGTMTARGTAEIEGEYELMKLKVEEGRLMKLKVK
ncbi:tetracycline-efflux transporter protein [Sesbania bispinosa]|nr:tetracycline-efflux transporter protein [Sesbania bispinosa]